jgi:photosystem II stability/assembly factor-like uncharacterized protein
VGTCGSRTTIVALLGIVLALTTASCGPLGVGVAPLAVKNPSSATTTITYRTPQDFTVDLGKPTSPPISVLSSVDCASQANCTAVGNSVEGVAKVPDAVAQTMFAISATTSDGGDHWDTFLLSTRIETAPALSCPSAKLCVAVGGTTDGNQRRGGEVLRTADGGETWTRSIPPPGVGRLTDVSCPTKTFCVAVGETPDGNGGVALVTTNFGKVWAHLSLPRGEERLSLVSCRSVNNCVVVVDNLRATIITTTNGGKSWAQTSLPQPTTGPTGTDISEGISCPSATRCFIVGGFTLGDGTPTGLVFTSSNRGNLWTSQPLPSGTTGLFGISCRTPTTCVAVGGGYSDDGGIVITTTDGGRTWTRGSEPASVSGLQSVSCPTLDKCVATGTSPSATSPPIPRPVVATSSDGGITWTRFNP